MKCASPNCEKPQVSQATKDALSVVGLTSEHCADCTTALLALLCRVEQHNREAASV